MCVMPALEINLVVPFLIWSWILLSPLPIWLWIEDHYSQTHQPHLWSSATDIKVSLMAATGALGS